MFMDHDLLYSLKQNKRDAYFISYKIINRWTSFSGCGCFTGEFPNDPFSAVNYDQHFLQNIVITKRKKGIILFAGLCLLHIPFLHLECTPMYHKFDCDEAFGWAARKWKHLTMTGKHLYLS
jgi:hypothetical protein